MALDGSPVNGAIYPRGFSTRTQWPWPLIKAGELVTLNYGKALREPDRQSGRIPVYGTNGQCGWHDESLAQGPGVILGRKGQGPLGVEWCDTPYWVIDTAYFVTADTDRIDLKFFYHLVKYIGLNHLKDGTSNPSLSRNTFASLLLPVPPLDIQQAIACILGALDDKIELNRRMNQTLEAMARAIFQSWFVDFDPVRAKAAGKQPPGLKPDIAALFPDAFEDSELGEIPSGWKVCTIEDVAERVAMGPFGSNIKVSTFVPEGIPVISGQHLHGSMLDDSVFNFVTESHAEQLRRSNVQRGDVILTHAGSIGQVAYIPETSRYERYVISQRQFYMRCNRKVMSPRFIVHYFKTHEGQHRLLANTSSTGVPSISRPVTYLRQLRILVPPSKLLQFFDGAVASIHHRVAHNNRESSTLAALRDALLSKLISGELRVPDAERIVGRRT